MSYSLLYWVLMLFWFIFGIWTNWPVAPAAGQRPNFGPVGGTFLMFILFVLIGIHDFGFPVHP